MSVVYDINVRVEGRWGNCEYDSMARRVFDRDVFEVVSSYLGVLCIEVAYADPPVSGFRTWHL